MMSRTPAGETKAGPPGWSNLPECLAGWLGAEYEEREKRHDDRGEEGKRTGWREWNNWWWLLMDGGGWRWLVVVVVVVRGRSSNEWTNKGKWASKKAGG